MLAAEGSRKVPSAVHTFFQVNRWMNQVARNDVGSRVMSKLLLRLSTVLVAIAFVSGCAAVRVSPPPSASHNPAVLALLDSAHSSLDSGRFAAAAASLERALRIEPRNPVLWQELAQAHLDEGNYQQAENFAARSNSWAGANRPLLAENWRIIREARARRGDDAGAQVASERARTFE